MKFRARALIAAASAAMILFTGCEWWDDTYKPAFLLSIHQVVKYPRATKIEREIYTFAGNPLWINVNSFLHSNCIKEIRPVPSEDNPGFYDLNLVLDDKGRLLWLQLSVQFANEEMALIVDGICYKKFVPDKLITVEIGGGGPEEKEVIARIKGPFDSIFAEELKEHSKRNYKFYHKLDWE